MPALRNAADKLPEILPALLFDEPSQPAAKIEWWFFHGRFSGEQVEERYFMLSLFRTRQRDRNDRPVDTFSALISVLDPATGRQSVSSRVDRTLVAILGRPSPDGGADPLASRVAAEELRQYGLPHEFECPDGTPSLSGEPMSFRWGDLSLASHSRSIHLAFAEPGSGRPLCFELTPVVPRLLVDAARRVGEQEEAMDYATWPGMQLRGTAGDLEITGEGWFDHQWGGQAWFRNMDSPPRVRGWDWLGFRLDDGSQGVLATHWDAESNEEIARHLTLRDGSGKVRVSHSFEWTPLRWWTSAGTRIT
ncbi:MAG: hypothetical protein NTY38_13625, partial [Acidobacteria bacterium]|nr:hypothetical protein [Acidobacteriota bacterium]